MLDNFDAPFPGKYHSLKWSRYQGKDVIPLWLADTDFPVSPKILSSIKHRLELSHLNYGIIPEELKDIICQYCFSRYRWKILPEWVVFTPSITIGLNIVRTLVTTTNNKHAGVTFIPTYHRLMKGVAAIPFQHYLYPLQLSSEQWHMDLSMVDTVPVQAGVYFLCNPHNPVGRAYTKEELISIAELCIAKQWLICSDEAHCDLLLGDHQHIPIASLLPEISRHTITLMSPGKAHGICGLGFAFAVIENPHLRSVYQSVCDGLVGDVNVLSIPAAMAAYTENTYWLQQQQLILERNASEVFNRINAIPYLSMQQVEATFLAWIDVSKLSVDDPQRFFESHGVGLADGHLFGVKGFLRLSFGCSWHTLDEALSRIEHACSTL